MPACGRQSGGGPNWPDSLHTAALVWLVDPIQRGVDVYMAPDRFPHLEEGEVLDGGDLLPGFQLPLERLFARVEKPQRRRRTRRKRSDQ